MIGHRVGGDDARPVGDQRDADSAFVEHALVAAQRQIVATVMRSDNRDSEFGAPRATNPGNDDQR